MSETMSRVSFLRDRVLVVSCVPSLAWWCDWCSADKSVDQVRRRDELSLVYVLCPDCSAEIGMFSPAAIAVASS